MFSPDAEWHNMMEVRLERHDREMAGYRNMWETVRNRMARDNEHIVVPMHPIPLLHLLAGYGTHVERTAELEPGEPNNCHRNSTMLWLNREVDAIGTGFALNGGCWRAHSWAVRGDSLVETTVPREAYWGIELTPAASLLFAMGEAPPEVTLQAMQDHPDLWALMQTVETLVAPLDPSGRNIWEHVDGTSVAHRTELFDK